MDFFNFPDLTTDVLHQAFVFLFGRLSRALDSRQDKVVSDSSSDSPDVVDPPDALEGRWQPVPPNPQEVETQLPRLRELAGALSPYERHPERVSVDDSGLLEDLDRLRTALETIYGQRITFRGEDREPTGTRVIQDVGTVAGDGQVVGVEGGRVGRADVDQRVADVREHGSVIGVRADEVDR